MLTLTPQARDAMASISGCQSMIRGTINQCKAMVASSITAQKLMASHHSQRLKLTNQRQPVPAAFDAVACSDMQDRFQVKVEVTVKLSPASDFAEK
jgi:hypothetical protein